ncbi:rod shape-determining protein MreD [Candidatus Omnitrophota bacterium]
MKKTMVLAVAIFIGLFIMMYLPDRLTLFSVKPDLLLLVAIFSTIYLRKKQGMAFACCAGLIKDVIGVASFGINALSFFTCSLCVKKLVKFIYGERVFEQIVFVFIIAMINSSIVALLSLFSFRLQVSGLIFLKGFIESTYTAVLSPIAFSLMKRCVPKYSF